MIRANSDTAGGPDAACILRQVVLQGGEATGEEMHPALSAAQLRSGVRTWSLAAHAAALTCLAWNKGEGTLTSGDAAGLVVVWAAAPGGWGKQMASQR